MYKIAVVCKKYPLGLVSEQKQVVAIFLLFLKALKLALSTATENSEEPMMIRKECLKHPINLMLF